MTILGYTWRNLWRKPMSPAVKEKTTLLIEKYFIGQHNNELVINADSMGKFLHEYSELVISRTLDVAFGMKG